MAGSDLSKRELLPQGARSLATICVTGIETEKGKNQADRQTDRKTRRQAKCVVSWDLVHTMALFNNLHRKTCNCKHSQYRKRTLDSRISRGVFYSSECSTPSVISRFLHAVEAAVRCASVVEMGNTLDQ
ncbi:hypothetical protein RRG08_011056 [Elysia crispata]|uniref:Uncharacterized protein n=1 Tax=Elysia crispata TaxID=231223 RepID=A0AAE1DBV0_9GAST|nr:hypothetical protein RRG08_011056 [Elysia crispata]